MSAFEKAHPGHFYAVGVGPGSPDLLTLRAARLVETADVILAPRSQRAHESLSLKTVAPFIRGQTIIEHIYPMQRDIEKTTRVWMEAARQVVAHCNAGQSVVQITLGDPLIYSTTCYLLPLVREALPEEIIHVVPGISAFQATACLFDEALTLQEDRMMLMPASDLAHVESALDHCETLVLYKAGRKIDALAELLERRGLLDRTRLVCYAEQEDRQFISKNIREVVDKQHGYMATVIVHVGRREWQTADSKRTESERA